MGSGQDLPLVSGTMSDWVDIASIAAVADAEEVGHAARDIKEVLDLVGHRRGHRQKGSVKAIKHCANMRFRRVKNRKMKLARHVSERIDLHNADSFRGAELIHVDERKPQKVKGRGNYKKILPGGILMLCFNMRGRTHRRRMRSKAPTPNPTCSAARTVAEVAGMSHTHVQHCRNAMSAFVIQRQKNFPKLISC